jgi:hypothetical protein
MGQLSRRAHGEGGGFEQDLVGSDRIGSMREQAAGRWWSCRAGERGASGGFGGSKKCGGGAVVRPATSPRHCSRAALLRAPRQVHLRRCRSGCRRSRSRPSGLVTQLVLELPPLDGARSLLRSTPDACRLRPDAQGASGFSSDLGAFLWLILFFTKSCNLHHQKRWQ